MGIGKSKPKAPDPMETARAQSMLDKEAILESAKHNQINQETPLGSVSWSGEIGSPDRTQTVTLSPEQQALLSQGQRTQAGVGGLIEALLPQVGHALSPGAWVGQGLEGPNTYLNPGIPMPELPMVTPGNLAEMIPPEPETAMAGEADGTQPAGDAAQTQGAQAAGTQQNWGQYINPDTGQVIPAETYNWLSSYWGGGHPGYVPVTEGAAGVTTEASASPLVNAMSGQGLTPEQLARLQYGSMFNAGGF